MKKNKLKKLFGWLVVIVLVIIVAWYTAVDRTIDNVTGHASKVQEKDSSKDSNQEPSAPQDIPLNGSSSRIESYTPDPEPEPPEPQYDTSTCNEYNCEPPSGCYHGVCKTPECTSDEDCVDNDPCTVDKCYFQGHVNAFCSTEVITEERNNDGCCPEGSWVDKDTDCKPICGNQKCEYGESIAMCEEDCLHAGSGPAPPPPSPPPQPENDT